MWTDALVSKLHPYLYYALPRQIFPIYVALHCHMHSHIQQASYKSTLTDHNGP